MPATTPRRRADPCVAAELGQESQRAYLRRFATELDAARRTSHRLTPTRDEADSARVRLTLALPGTKAGAVTAYQRLLDLVQAALGAASWLGLGVRVIEIDPRRRERAAVPAVRHPALRELAVAR